MPVGVGFLMLMRHHSKQKFPPNSIIHIGMRHPNPPKSDVNGDGIVDVIDIIYVAKCLPL